MMPAPRSSIKAIAHAASQLPWESCGKLSSLCKSLREQTIRLIAREECLKGGWDAFYNHAALRFTAAGIISVFEECSHIPIGPQSIEETLAMWQLLLYTETAGSRRHAAYLCWIAEKHGEESLPSLSSHPCPWFSSPLTKHSQAGRFGSCRGGFLVVQRVSSSIHSRDRHVACRPGNPAVVETQAHMGPRANPGLQSSPPWPAVFLLLHTFVLRMGIPPFGLLEETVPAPVPACCTFSAEPFLHVFNDASGGFQERLACKSVSLTEDNEQALLAFVRELPEQREVEMYLHRLWPLSMGDVTFLLRVSAEVRVLRIVQD
jgi:hypothetical protein